MSENPKPKSKKKLGSYPLLSVVFSISLALFVLGLFGLLIIHTQSLTRMIQENVEVQVYLKNEISESQETQILRNIAEKEYVVKTEEGADITFVSKEAAAEQFAVETGEDFSDFLGENPLRNLFRVKISPEYQLTEEMDKIKSDLEGIQGVYEVEYVASLVDSINNNLGKMSLLLLGFSTILIIVVIMLINNTIRLALFSQRFLIRSMQLVGATSGFIRKPFLQRASLYGLIAGLVSSLLLFILLQYSYNRVEELASLKNTEMMLLLFGALILLGITLSVLSTFRAMQKYLRLSLDELY